MAEKLISLYDIDGLVLIVEHNSGVIYSNQAGGQVCAQPRQEGVLSPLDFSAESNQQLADFPFDPGGMGITAEAADFIDGLLAANVSTRFLKVDRERLADSWEAWVFVRIEQTPSHEEGRTHSGYFGPIYGFAAGRGVLTWLNSD